MSGYVDLLGTSIIPSGSIDVISISSNLNLDYVNASNILSVDDSKNVISSNITGTANQITVSGVGSNNIVFNTPQDIAPASSVIFGDITDNALVINNLVATDANKKLINRLLSGTNNQININTLGNTTTFSLPQDIDTTSSVIFNNITDNSLTINNLVATDSANKLINRIISGTTDQVNITTVGTTTTFSLPQSIATTSSVTFANITDNALTINSLVATDSSNKLINRIISGTANQVNINTVGTTTTFSLPQSIHTGASPQFTGLNLSGLTASKIVVTDGSNNISSSTFAPGDFISKAGDTYTGTLTYSGSGNGLVFSNGGTIKLNKTANFGAIQIAPQTDNAEISMSIWDGSSSFTGSNGTLIGRNIGTSGFSIYNKNTASSGIAFGIDSTTGKCYIPTLTASKIMVTDGSKYLSSSTLAESDIVTIGTAQTITANKTFSGTTILSGITNLSTLTASKLLVTDASNNIASSSYASLDLVLTSTNQTIAGNKTLSGTLNLSAITASTYIGLDASKNVINMANPSTALLASNNIWVGTQYYDSVISNSSFFGADLFHNRVRSGKFCSQGTLTNALTIANGANTLIPFGTSPSINYDIGQDVNFKFVLPVVGQYLLTWSVRLTAGVISEVATYAVWSGDTSYFHGITSVPYNSKYVSSSTMINTTDVNQTCWINIFNGTGGNITLDDTSIQNQIAIKYLGS